MVKFRIKIKELYCCYQHKVNIFPLCEIEKCRKVERGMIIAPILLLRDNHIYDRGVFFSKYRYTFYNS